MVYAVETMAPGLARERDHVEEEAFLQSLRHTSSAKDVLFTVGVISDIQYADVDDCLSVLGKRRYYRATLLHLEKAVEDWTRCKVGTVLHCGDIIDGRNVRLGSSSRAMSEVLARLANIDVPVRHVLGNHCLANFSRTQLIETLRMDVPQAREAIGFYSFSPHPRWRFVVLDTCDVSMLGRHWSDPKYQAAWHLLQAKNPNEDKFSNRGLVDVERRFSMVNGGVSQAQLEWLENELVASEKQRQRVVICCHIPVLPGVGPKSALVWNYDEVLEVIHRHRVVAAVISGHIHTAGHRRDTCGIHHLVLPGVVEIPLGEPAHGFLDVQQDALVLRGFGLQKPLNMSARDFKG